MAQNPWRRPPSYGLYTARRSPFASLMYLTNPPPSSLRGSALPTSTWVWREFLQIPGEGAPARRFKGLDVPASDAALGGIRIRHRDVQESAPAYEEAWERRVEIRHDAREPDMAWACGEPPSSGTRPAPRSSRPRTRRIWRPSPRRSAALPFSSGRGGTRPSSALRGVESACFVRRPALPHAHLGGVEVLAHSPARLAKADGAVGSDHQAAVDEKIRTASSRCWHLDSSSAAMWRCLLRAALSPVALVGPSTSAVPLADKRIP
ncbi:hypothetical protein DL770_003447 [Monosporascus sp. CRB-9-2]|nr:hypothetical protein DL770_003447 [Monosporascus sp. CRB-9-2]